MNSILIMFRYESLSRSFPNKQKITQELCKDIYIHFSMKSIASKIYMLFMAHLQQKLWPNKPIVSPCLSVRQSICNKNITVQDNSVVFDTTELFRKLSINATILFQICQQ
jgi:hypothetical protein